MVTRVLSLRVRANRTSEVWVRRPLECARGTNPVQQHGAIVAITMMHLCSILALLNVSLMWIEGTPRSSRFVSVRCVALRCARGVVCACVASHLVSVRFVALRCVAVRCGALRCVASSSRVDRRECRLFARGSSSPYGGWREFAVGVSSLLVRPPPVFPPAWPRRGPSARRPTVVASYLVPGEGAPFGGGRTPCAHLARTLRAPCEESAHRAAPSVPSASAPPSVRATHCEGPAAAIRHSAPPPSRTHTRLTHPPPNARASRAARALDARNPFRRAAGASRARSVVRILSRPDDGRAVSRTTVSTRSFTPPVWWASLCARLARVIRVDERASAERQAIAARRGRARRGAERRAALLLGGESWRSA